MTMAAVALVAAAASSVSQAPAPRTPPIRAIVVSITRNQPSCPALSLSERLQYRDAASWLSDPYQFWFIVDSAGQLVSNLRQLVLLDTSQLRAWSDRNRNGVPEGDEVRPFREVVAFIDPAVTTVEGSWVCRAKAAAEIHKGYYPANPPSLSTSQTLWEIEIPTDTMEATYRYGSTPVTGVRFALTQKGDEFVGLLTNERTSPIEAYRVSVDYNGGGISTSFDMFRFDRQQNALGEPMGPIGPGETREIRLGRVAKDREAIGPVVKAVLFEDMHFEGEHAHRTEWLEAREAYALGLTDWLAALRSAAGESDPARAHQVLADKLADRQARGASRMGLSQQDVDGIPAQLLPRVARGEAPLAQLIDYLIVQFERELKRATRHRAEAK